MRSKDYADIKKSFKPLSPVEMVRVALVNGINPEVEHNSDERKKYLGLLKEFIESSNANLDRLFEFLQESNADKRNTKAIGGIRTTVHYDSKRWKELNYKTLEENGVIMPLKLNRSDLKGLAQKLVDLPRHKVIGLSQPIEREGIDYLKHIPPRQKFVLNGKDVVVAFAKEHGIELPGGYLKRGGPPPVSIYKALADAGFTIKAAMETGTGVIRTDDYLPRDISALVVKHLNGDELRMHHHDYVESAEFWLYARAHELEIAETLGDRLKADGDKYVLSVYDTPSKSRMNLTHRVEICYLPDFKDPKNKTLEWMKTRVSCDCEWALNLRNFSFGLKETKHTAYTLETHGGMVILQLQTGEDGILIESPKNMNPIPTINFSRFVDVIRYQLMQGHKNDDYVKETGIEILANEFWKIFGLEKMYWPKEKVANKILDGFY
ncbi:hypothetical protein J4209_06330 [Candidatus Woesearchaeota archaeon]|nr:hypothetical protein [Candidatus Woesearchaeota archaeon]